MKSVRCPECRWLFFGLIHGFGFATVLRSMELSRGRLASSLFWFNFGVEGGQVVIVSLVFPLLWLMRRYSWQPRVIQGAAAVISGSGTFLFFQRIFFH